MGSKGVMKINIYFLHALVSDRCLISTNSQNSSVGIGVGKEKIVWAHLYLKRTFMSCKKHCVPHAL